MTKSILVNNANHNQSHSNISVLSEEKTPLKFKNGIDSLSPISYIKNIKYNPDELSQNSLAIFGRSEINSTTNSKNYKKFNKFSNNSKFTGNELLVPSSGSQKKSYQSRFLRKNKDNIQLRAFPKKLHDNLTSASSIPRQLNNKDEVASTKVSNPEFIGKKLNLSKLNNKTTIESTNTATTNRNKKIRKFKSNKENFTPIQSTDFSKMYEFEDTHQAVNEQVEENDHSPNQESEFGFFSHKNVNNLTLEEYLLNYGRPYRNSSMNKIEAVTTWRVVNEDPSESYVSVDDEFLNEIVDPLTVSGDQKRNISCDAHNPKQASSLERK